MLRNVLDIFKRIRFFLIVYVRQECRSRKFGKMKDKHHAQDHRTSIEALNFDHTVFV